MRPCSAHSSEVLHYDVLKAQATAVPGVGRSKLMAVARTLLVNGSNRLLGALLDVRKSVTCVWHPLQTWDQKRRVLKLASQLGRASGWVRGYQVQTGLTAFVASCRLPHGVLWLGRLKCHWVDMPIVLRFREYAMGAAVGGDASPASMAHGTVLRPLRAAGLR